MTVKVDLKKLHNKKTGLVLSGGVVKAAAWHLGVVMALEDLGYRIKNNATTDAQLDHPLVVDMMVGSSAGSMIAAMLAAGLSARDVMKASLGLDKFHLKPIGYTDIFTLNKRIFKGYGKSEYRELAEYPGLISTLLKPFTKPPGFFTTEGLRTYLLKHIFENDAFEDFKSDLFFVASQLDHSQKVIFTKAGLEPKRHPEGVQYRISESVSQAVAASMSLPPFFAPYPLKHPVTGKEDYYIDGEIRETLSTHVAVDQGCDVVISSWTHAPYHFTEAVGSLVQYGLPSIAVQSIYLLIEKKIQSSRDHRRQVDITYDAVKEYCAESGISKKDQKALLGIIEDKFNFNKKRVFIDIAPDSSDAKFFFINSFSLNKKHTSYVIKSGYRRAMDLLG